MVRLTQSIDTAKVIFLLDEVGAWIPTTSSMKYDLGFIATQPVDTEDGDTTVGPKTFLSSVCSKLFNIIITVLQAFHNKLVAYFV